MNNVPRATALFIACCLSLAACGSNKTTSTSSTIASASAAQTATTPATATTTPAHATSSSTTRATASRTTSTTSTSKATTSAPVAVPLPARLAFTLPIPTTCLTRSGYRYHHLITVGELAASRRPVPATDTTALIFVDGPYRTAAAAQTAAQGLAASGTEFAAAGGRYEVSATPLSHSGAAVKAIAACLKGRRG